MEAPQIQCPNCGKIISLVPTVYEESADGSLDFSVPDYTGLLALFEDI